MQGQRWHVRHTYLLQSLARAAPGRAERRTRALRLRGPLEPLPPECRAAQPVATMGLLPVKLAQLESLHEAFARVPDPRARAAVLNEWLQVQHDQLPLALALDGKAVTARLAHVVSLVAQETAAALRFLQARHPSP